jgi:protein-S-isoprenylcysteine O-methyltransferase Ste14
MAIYRALIIACWFVVLVTWIASAPSAKRTTGGGRWGRGIGLRVAVLILVLLASRLTGVGDALRNVLPSAINRNPIAGLIGVLLSALGVGLAVSARIALGRNWGMPMSRIEKPELVTSGPYAVIRHPIYTGLLVATLGSAIGLSILWLLPLVVSGPYLIYSARREEQLMMEQFPEQYSAYMKRTKMLIPRVL